MEGDDNLLPKSEPTKRFILEKGVRFFILILLLLGVSITNMTVNIFKTASPQIRKALLISDTTHSYFTLAYNFGQFISTICLMLVFRRPDRKQTILFSLFGCSGLLLLYQFTENQMILLPCQFFIGFCVMVINIYTILWIDQFAFFKYKTVFLAANLLFKTLGNVFGVLLNHIVKGENYKTSFLIEAIVSAAIGFALVPFSSVYFSSDLLLYKGKSEEEEWKWRAKTQKEGGDEDKTSYAGGDSIYRYRQSGASIKELYTGEVAFGFTKNKIYICGFFASAILGTATAGFNFWVFDFLDQYYGNKDLPSKVKTRILFNLSGPFIATVIILLTTLKVGNYHNRSCPILMFFYYCLAALSGNIVTSASNAQVLFVFAVLYHIGATAMVPYLQGVNLSGGTPSKKPFGVLIANAGGLFLGALPAPMIYNALLKTYSKQTVIFIFMKYLLVGVVFNFFMMYFKWKSYPPKNLIKKDIELSEK